MFFPGSDACRCFRPSVSIHPLHQSVVVIEVKIIDVTGSISAGCRICDDCTLGLAASQGKFLATDIFYFSIWVPGDVKRKQQPVIVINKQASTFLSADEVVVSISCRW